MIELTDEVLKIAREEERLYVLKQKKITDWKAELSSLPPHERGHQAFTLWQLAQQQYSHACDRFYKMCPDVTERQRILAFIRQEAQK